MHMFVHSIYSYSSWVYQYALILGVFRANVRVELFVVLFALFFISQDEVVTLLYANGFFVRNQLSAHTPHPTSHQIFSSLASLLFIICCKRGMPVLLSHSTIVASTRELKVDTEHSSLLHLHENACLCRSVPCIKCLHRIFRQRLVFEQPTTA